MLLDDADDDSDDDGRRKEGDAQHTGSQSLMPEHDANCSGHTL